MNWLKLTNENDGKNIWINFDCAFDMFVKDDVTFISPLYDNDYAANTVKESPEQILHMLQKKQIKKWQLKNIHA